MDELPVGPTDEAAQEPDSPLEEAYDMMRYFPLDDGFTWTYVIPRILKTAVVRVREARREIHGAGRQFQVIENNGSVGVYDLVPEAGLFWVREDVDTQGWSLHPSETLLMIPSRLAMGVSHTGSTACVRKTKGGKRIDYGAVSIATTLQALEDITLPVGHFPNSLVLTSRLAYTSDSGQIFALDSKMWLVEGVGAIKAFHTYIFEAFSEFEGHRWKLGFELQEARLGAEKIP